jgi:cold shock CspA family protein
MGKQPYGFLISDADGKDIYFSERQIGIEIFSKLKAGQPVQAKVVTLPDGRLQARSLRVIDNPDENLKPF